MSCVCWCVFPTCMCIQMWFSAFPPTLGSNTVIDNRCKGEGTADKEAKCADQSIQRQKECGLRQGCREQIYSTMHSLAQMPADQHSSVLFPFCSLSFLLPLFLFVFSFFPEGCLQLKRRELILSSFLPPFLLFNTPLCHCLLATA